MTGTWTWRGRLAALLPAALTASVLLPVLAAVPAAARSCSELTATATSTGGRTQVLLSLPAGLTGARLRAGEVMFAQDGLDLPVLSVAPVPSTETDLVLVLDSSAAAAPVVDRVRAAARALLRALSPGTSVAVLTTGGPPTVVHELARGPRAALPGVTDLTPAGPHALVDAVLAGVRLLPTDPRRQQQLVVVSGSADDGSAASWPAARQLLVRRGVALDVVDLGPAPSLPGAGAQCPGAVPAAAAAGAAQALAAQVEDRRLALLPAVTGASPVQVSVTHGGTVVSTTLATRNDLPAAAPTQRPTSAGDGSSGAVTLALAFLVGLLGLLSLVTVLAVRSTRGGAVRAAVHELRDARRAGLPPAEAARRRDDARLDLSVALGGGLSARQRAELAAHDETLVRAAAAEHRRAADERAAAFARSAARRERSLLQAEQAAATERAAREATAHPDQLRPLPATGPSGADPVAVAALADAERALAAQRLAAQEAMTRRAEAERLADEAEARAERERVAAGEAQRDREAAERAAAESAARAAEELRTVGAASEERRLAEEQARA
ncbi:MAG: VWA domain-containing protein, partial [Sporichthyaceae bacterium]